MGIEINIEHNFHDMQKVMDELGNSDIVGAARTALNSSLRRARSQASIRLRKRINLTSKALKSRMTVYKARGGSLRQVEGAIVFSGIPIGMINFIVGKKTPIKQSGIAVKKRRVLKARIKGGQTFKLQGAFIQDIQSKQVFRHMGKGRRARKISTKSLAKIIMEENINKMIEDIVMKRFDREYRKQLQWRWDKTSAKASKTPLRLPR